LLEFSQVDERKNSPDNSSRRHLAEQFFIFCLQQNILLKLSFALRLKPNLSLRLTLRLTLRLGLSFSAKYFTS
jgi:hypothetical protein